MNLIMGWCFTEFGAQESMVTVWVHVFITNAFGNVIKKFCLGLPFDQNKEVSIWKSIDE